MGEARYLPWLHAKPELFTVMETWYRNAKLFHKAVVGYDKRGEIWSSVTIKLLEVIEGRGKSDSQSIHGLDIVK